MKKKEVSRRAPTKSVLRALFARSGNCCAFPGCKNALIDDEDEFIGNVCHIEAASEGGQRFNPDQSDEERRDYSNLMLLCYEHHIKTNNVIKYPVEKLREMKSVHEAKPCHYTVTDVALNQVFNEGLNKLQELLEKHVTDFQKHTSNFNGSVTKAEENNSITQDKLDVILAAVKSQSKEQLQVMDVPEFDLIKELREKGQTEMVLSTLSKLKNSKWDKLSDESKFKLLINEALSFLDLENNQKAAENFIEALQYNQHGETALSYAAVGYRILSDHTKAKEYIEKTLAINPKNINAFNTIIQLRQDEDFQLIKSSIPIDMLEIPEISYNLALVARQQGKFDEAIELLQTTVDNAKEETASFVGALGSTILQSITEHKFSYVTNQIRPETKTKISYAVKMMSRALESYEKKNYKNPHVSNLLINISIGKKLLNDKEAVIQNSLKAYTLFPSDVYVTRFLMITYLESGHNLLALEICEKLILITETKENTEALVFKAQILQILNRAQESLNILLEINQTTLEIINRKWICHLIVMAYHALNRVSDTQSYLQTLIRELPSEVYPELEASLFYWDLKDKEKAKVHRDNAVNLVNENTAPEELHELGQLFFTAQEFENAALIYERITDKTVYSALTKKLIQSHFNAGDKNKALNICLGIESTYGLDQFLTDGICMIYESVDDINNAIDICKRYLLLNPDDQVIIIRLAFLYHRIGLKEKLSETLERVSNIDYTLNYDHLYRLAYVYFINEQFEKGLDIAYETRRANYNNGTSHVKYFGLHNEFKLSMKSQKLSTVIPECVVQLEDKAGTSFFYIIEKRKDVIAERSEINVQDQIAILLLGKKTGEEVILDKGNLGQQKYTVKEITTKYLYAYQETVRLFGSRFINQPGIAMITIAPNETAKESLENLFKNQEANVANENQLNELYKSNQATIGILSSIRKINPIRMYHTLALEPTMGIRSTWHIQELVLTKDLINSNAPLVLDISTIVTLFINDYLPYLEKLSNIKIIAQATYDDITDLLRELRGTSDGMMTIGKINNEFVKHVVSAEDVAKSISYYRQLEQWVKTHCEIRPAREVLKMKTSEVEERSNLFGKSFHDSMLISKEVNGALVSDDNVFRQLAYSEHQVNGLSSFLLSIFMLDKKIITKEVHNNFVLKLFTINFKDIPCNVDILTTAVKTAKYHFTDPFATVVQGLSSPLIPDNIACLIAIDFLYELYSDTSIQIYSPLPLETIRLNLAIPVLVSLFNRSVDIKVLLQLLQYKFKLLPQQKVEIIVIIKDLLKI